MLTAGAEVWSRRNSIDRRQPGLALAVVAVFALLAQRYYDNKYFQLYSYYLAVGMCGLYALVLRAESRKKISRMVSSVFLLVLVLALEIEKMKIINAKMQM